MENYLKNSVKAGENGLQGKRGIQGLSGDNKCCGDFNDPNDLNTFYVGTGESYTGAEALGNGLWKSSNGGETWSNVFGGKSETEKVYRSSGNYVKFTNNENLGPY